MGPGVCRSSLEGRRVCLGTGRRGTAGGRSAVKRLMHLAASPFQAEANEGVAGGCDEDDEECVLRDVWPVITGRALLVRVQDNVAQDRVRETIDQGLQAVRQR